MNAIDCLITIPCFRESARLPPFLDSLCLALDTAPFGSRVLIVDDGSGGPRMKRRGRSPLPRAPGGPGLSRSRCACLANRGKGGAVYAGWQSPEAAAARLLCLVDADGSVLAMEVVRLIAMLLADSEESWTALFGSRAKLLGTRVERLPSRHYVGRVFATLATLITGLEAYDSQCGLKVVRRTAYDAIATSLHETRFVFDVELTAQLQRHGFAIREVPIDWAEVSGSKVRVVRDSLRMAWGLLRIRRRLRDSEP